MNMMNKVEVEVDEIRLKIYEQTKDLSISERRNYYRRIAETAAKKYGFKIYKNAETPAT